ncbi:PRD domain-containing protein [Enterobacteriaceae bacterium LUAb1]
MYLISKVINNNVILVLNSTNQELIILGKGIGFNSKPGQHYEPDSTNEIFVKPQHIDIYQIINSIPLDIIALTNDVINECKRVITEDLSDSLILTLSEHLMYAIERSKKNEEGITLYEVPYLYKNEYDAGRIAVNYINNKYGHRLPASEASLIALYFVNAKINNKNVGDTLRLTQIMFKIVNVINYSFHVKIDTHSDNFARFTNHLRYFLIRCKKGTNTSHQVSRSLSECVENELLKNYSCAKKIAKLMENEYQYHTHPDEIIYLALHIERLLNTK